MIRKYSSFQKPDVLEIAPIAYAVAVQFESGLMAALKMVAHPRIFSHDTSQMMPIRVHMMHVNPEASFLGSTIFEDVHAAALKAYRVESVIAQIAKLDDDEHKGNGRFNCANVEFRFFAKGWSDPFYRCGWTFGASGHCHGHDHSFPARLRPELAQPADTCD